LWNDKDPILINEITILFEGEMVLGWESYNLLLFAKGNKATNSMDEFGDSVVEIVGDLAFSKSFAETIQISSTVPK
jgi:hypothetical protein